MQHLGLLITLGVVGIVGIVAIYFINGRSFRRSLGGVCSVVLACVSGYILFIPLSEGVSIYSLMPQLLLLALAPILAFVIIWSLSGGRRPAKRDSSTEKAPGFSSNKRRSSDTPTAVGRRRNASSSREDRSVEKRQEPAVTLFQHNLRAEEARITRETSPGIDLLASSQREAAYQTREEGTFSNGSARSSEPDRVRARQERDDLDLLMQETREIEEKRTFGGEQRQPSQRLEEVREERKRLEQEAAFAEEQQRDRQVQERAEEEERLEREARLAQEQEYHRQAEEARRLAQEEEERKDQEAQEAFLIEEQSSQESIQQEDVSYPQGGYLQPETSPQDGSENEAQFEREALLAEERRMQEMIEAQKEAAARQDALEAEAHAQALRTLDKARAAKAGGAHVLAAALYEKYLLNPTDPTEETAVQEQLLDCYIALKRQEDAKRLATSLQARLDEAGAQKMQVILRLLNQ